MAIRIDYNHTHTHFQNYTDLTETPVLTDNSESDIIDYESEKDKKTDASFSKLVTEVTEQMKDIMNVTEKVEDNE